MYFIIIIFFTLNKICMLKTTKHHSEGVICLFDIKTIQFSMTDGGHILADHFIKGNYL